MIREELRMKNPCWSRRKIPQRRRIMKMLRQTFLHR